MWGLWAEGTLREKEGCCPRILAECRSQDRSEVLLTRHHFSKTSAGGRGGPPSSSPQGFQ